MKKVISLILCLMLMLSLATTAFADENTTTITFVKGAEGAVYSAYRLLNVTHDNEAGSYHYTLNEQYQEIMKNALGVASYENIIPKLAEMTPDGKEIRKFADAVYAAIQAEKMEPDAVSEGSVISAAEQGYYLMAETQKSSTDPADTFSLVMLDTLGKDSIEVTTKESAPTVEKKVKETNDSTTNKNDNWQDVADYDIGDEVEYKLTGTVSGRYENYKNYYYSFEDTLSDGLDYVAGTAEITINGVDVTDEFGIDYENKKLTITANLKVVDEAVTDLTIDHNSEVVVLYKAKLNADAVVGATGNPNEVVLKYQNDPYWNESGDPENPGETPEDVTVVFTFKVNVNKVDENGDALTGAGFTLFKYDYYANNGTWVPVGEEIKGETMTTFTFPGLDAGKYKLEETTIPDGYKKAAIIEFEIKAEYKLNENTGKEELASLTVVDQDGDPLYKEQVSEDTGADSKTNAVFTIDLPAGELETNVVNDKGAELPSTGGMGTTLFYVLGGMMVLAAVVLLVTKKRMASAE